VPGPGIPSRVPARPDSRPGLSLPVSDSDSDSQSEAPALRLSLRPGADSPDD